MRDDGRGEHGAPVGSGQERGQDVGEENQGEPLEDTRDLTVGRPEQQRHDEPGVERRPDESLHAGHHLADLGHAAEVRPDVDDVGDDEQGARAPEDRPGIGG